MTAAVLLAKKGPRRATSGDFDAKHPRDPDGQFKDKPSAAETAFKARHPKTRFKLDGMNRRQRKAVMESFDSFAAEFPSTARKVAFVATDREMAGVGSAFVKKTSRGSIRFGILLKPNHSTKPAPEMASVVSRTVASQKRDTDPLGVALTHELGHALAFHGEAETFARHGQRFPAHFETNRVGALSRATQDPIIGDITRARNKSLADYRTWSESPPLERIMAPRPAASRYALQDPAEFFAENFAARRHSNIYVARMGNAVPARAVYHPDTASWEERYKMLADRFDAIESEGRLRKGLTEDLAAVGWEPICSGIPEGNQLAKAAPGDLHVNGAVEAPKRRKRTKKAPVSEMLKEAKRFPKGNPKGGKFMPGAGGTTAPPSTRPAPGAAPARKPPAKKNALKVDAAATAAERAAAKQPPPAGEGPRTRRPGQLAADLVDGMEERRKIIPKGGEAVQEAQRKLEMLRRDESQERQEDVPAPSGPGPSIMAKAQRRYPRGHPEGGKFMPGGRGVSAAPRSKRKGTSRKRKLATAAVVAAAGYGAANAGRKVHNRRTINQRTNRIGVTGRRAGRFAAHDALRAAKLSHTQEEHDRKMADAGRKLRQANAHTRRVRQDAVRDGGRKKGSKNLPKRADIVNTATGRKYAPITRDGWAYRVSELRRAAEPKRRRGRELFGPVKKRRAPAAGTKVGSGKAHLQRRYPAGHPKGGQFIPGGGKTKAKAGGSKASKMKRLGINAAYAATVGGAVAAALAEQRAGRNRVPKADQIKALDATTPTRRRARFAAHDMLRELSATGDKKAYDAKKRGVAEALRQTNNWTRRDAKERIRLGLDRPERPYSRRSASRGGYTARAVKTPTPLSYSGAAARREGIEVPPAKGRARSKAEGQPPKKPRTRTVKPKVEPPVAEKPKRTRRKDGGVTKAMLLEAVIVEKKVPGTSGGGQKRYPKGHPKGGQWMPKNGSEGSVLDPVARKPKKKRPKKEKPETDDEEGEGKKKEPTRAERLEAQQWAVRRNVARTAALGSVAMLGTAIARGSRFDADRRHLEARVGLGVRNLGLRLNYRPKGYGSKTWGRSTVVSSRRLGDIQLDDRSGQARAVYFRIGNPLRKELQEILKHPGHADQSVHGHRHGMDPGRRTVGRKPGGRTASVVQGHDPAGRYTRDSARRRASRRRRLVGTAAALAVGYAAVQQGSKVQHRRARSALLRENRIPKATEWSQKRIDAEAKKIEVMLGSKGGVKQRRGKNGKYLPG